jgi:hypothetical protein
MTCLHSLKNTGKAFLLALVLFSLSLAVYSQTPEDQIYQALEQIAIKHPDSKPQIKLIANGLQRIAERQTVNSEALQTTIDGQAVKIVELQTTINGFPALLANSTASHLAIEDDLKSYAASLRTEATVSETINLIQLIVNGFQIAAYLLKK